MWSSYVKDLIAGRFISEGSYCEAHVWRILVWGSYVKDFFEDRLICEGSYCERYMRRIPLWGSYVKDLFECRLICEGSSCEAHMWRFLLWSSYVKDFIEDKLICEGFHWRQDFSINMSPILFPGTPNYPSVLTSLSTSPTCAASLPNLFLSYTFPILQFRPYCRSLRFDYCFFSLGRGYGPGIRSWQSVAILAQPCKHTNWSVSLCTAHS